jgi:branched-chain amino acid aminotransferase
MAGSDRLVWMNGDLVPEAEARLSIYDSALMFGDMVFEMTRSFNRVQFKLREHLDRLAASMRLLEIRIPFTVPELERVVRQTIEANADAFGDDDEHRVLIDVSRGLLATYADVVGIRAGPNVLVAVFPLHWTVAGMGPLFDRGVNAVIPSQRAIPAALLDPKVKNRSRLHYQLANLEVSRYVGNDNWALLLDPDGLVAEGTGSNFLLVKDGVIVSPHGRNILRGISRAYVMNELAPQIGVTAVEANLDRYDVVNADEAFMTATPFCLLPVTSVDGMPIGTGRPGRITRALLERWSQNVGVDIPRQIQRWDAVRPQRHLDAPSPYAFRGR